MKKILILFVVLLSLSLFGCDMPKEETREIKSIKLIKEDESYSSGLFVLGMGVYQSGEETVTKYYLYVKGEEGFRLQSIASGKVELVETNEVKPSIKGHLRQDGSIIEYNNYVIYVPVGTIYEEYEAKI